MYINACHTLINSTFNNGVTERALEHFREDGKDVNTHATGYKSKNLESNNAVTINAAKILIYNVVRIFAAYGGID